MSAAFDLDAAFAEAHENFSNGRIETAAGIYRRVIQTQPDFAHAHTMLGLMLLTLGRYHEGWQELEWRITDTFRTQRAMDRLPTWDGGPLNGRRILVHAEQGFGDSLHLVRYVPMVAERGGQVVLFCQRELKGLFRSVKGATEVVAEGDSIQDLQVQIPFFSLPKAFATTMETIPARVPYLAPPPARAEHWAARLTPETRLKVGVCWSGNPESPVNRTRAAPFEALAPVFGVGGVAFYGLQLGTPRQDIAGLPESVPFTDLAGDIEAAADGFSEAAAIASCLDVVVVVDTALAHLAGALARPTWLALPYAGDWRWHRDRDDSPWYPTLRLFRQPAPGAWGSVFERIAAALRQATAGPRPSPAPRG